MHPNLVTLRPCGRSVRLALLLLVSLLALLASTGTARAGDYTVNFGASGQPLAAPDFRGYSSGSPPWQVLPTQVYAAPATYSGGSYGMYRFYIRSGLTVSRFCATSVVSTSNDYLRYQVDANNTTVYGKTYGSGTYTTCTTSGHTFVPGNYIDVALIFDRSTTVTGTSNKLTYSKIAVTYRDLGDPVVSGVSAPSGWIGPNACNVVGWTVSDSGAGVQQTQLLRSVNVDYTWTRPGPYVWPKPGAAAQSFSTCLPNPGSTGTHSYVVTGLDFSGNQTAVTIPSQSWDVTQPSVTTQAQNAQQYDSYRPTFEFSVSDAHSGIASASAAIDGQAVSATVSGSAVTFQPASELSLGQHTIAVTAIDRVGNRATTTRTIVIGDTTPPTLSVARPLATEHGNDPVLDVTASDDKSGVDTSTWSVTVNGEPLPVTGGTTRLQASVGHVVNGTHAIVVSVADAAGNRTSKTISYAASNDAITPPGFNGIYLVDKPDPVFERQTYTVQGIAVRNGRPVTAGRFELSKNGTIIAGKDTSPDGSVSMVATITTPGPLVMSLTGTDLAAASFGYAFHAVGSAPWCRTYYQQDTATCDRAWGTSGIVGLDHVRPAVRLSLPVRTRVIRRGLDFQLRTSERATATVTLPRSIRKSASIAPGTTNHVRFRITRTIANKLNLKPGACIRLPVTLTAKDGAGNAMTPARYAFRVCG